jgi:hypothetical protein
MLPKHLHIIALDVPYPPDYGGVFDLFFKLKALHALGVQIHLHCFDYGRGKQDELNKYCAEVHYYERRMGAKGFSFSIPYIVASRANEELLTRLKKDVHPIIMEGVHCTYFLHEDKLPGRKILVRLHNVEYQYYHHLAETTTSKRKGLYYSFECGLLKKYEKRIANKATIIAVNKKDAETYRRVLGAQHAHYLPVFIPFETVQGQAGIGTYCLYHGNLSVAENEKAVEWLLEKIFPGLGIPLIIAGKNPSHKLVKLAQQFPSTTLCANPSEEEMKGLVAKAQVHLVPSFNITGIKIKLLNALFNGRHCLVNRNTIEGTGLESACIIANDEESFIQQVKSLYKTPFTDEHLQIRCQLLETEFNNSQNAERLVELIF